MTVTDDSPIEVLDLPVRPYNCLKRADINTVGQLAAWTLYDLCNLRMLGVKSLAQIEEALDRAGFKLSPHHLGYMP